MAATMPTEPGLDSRASVGRRQAGTPLVPDIDLVIRVRRTGMSILGQVFGEIQATGRFLVSRTGLAIGVDTGHPGGAGTGARLGVRRARAVEEGDQWVQRNTISS